MRIYYYIITAVVGLLTASAGLAQIDFASLDTTKLQPVPQSQLPRFGTFWLEEVSGVTAPLPCPPVDLPDAPVYALPNGQFLVDARNCQHVEPPLDMAASSPLDASPMGSPMDITSNAWFSQIAVSNYTYVSLNSQILNADGSARVHELPVGVMFPVHSVDLSVPLAQWQPVGQTNPIRPCTFNVPYNPAAGSKAFFRICAQLAPSFDPGSVPPYSLVFSNPVVLTDKGVTLTWTNSQPGFIAESDSILEMDTSGHSYLIDSVVTRGATDSLSFELTSLTGLTFERYSAPAATAGDQFFLPTNYLNNPDVVTVPYVINTNSGRLITEVAAYDVTDPNNVQFLGHVTGIHVNKGTLEIPGTSLWPGVDYLQFRAIDAAYGETDTEVTITNNSLVSIVSPILAFQTNGASRIATSWGGYGVALELVTTATTGNWVVNTYNPSGALIGTVTGPVATLGQHIIYDDGGTESTDYPYPYYDMQVTVQGPMQQAAMVDPPPPVNNHSIRVYLLPRQSNAGAITGYDDTVLPLNSGTRQFVLDTLQSGVSGTFAFVYHTIDFEDSYWKTVSSPKANNLNAGLLWGWRAIQAGLAGTDYDVTIPGVQGWINQIPDRPILGLAVHAHGGVDSSGNPVGIQGPAGVADSALTKENLEQEWGFDKRTNAIAIGVFTGCHIGANNDPFLPFILRNEGVPGEIDSVTAANKHIRPCFALAWTQDTDSVTTCEYLSWWTYYATLFGGSGPFQYSLDEAVGQALQAYTGTGGTYVTWSGTAGRHLDRFAQ
jgi:hypothetical protein